MRIRHGYGRVSIHLMLLFIVMIGIIKANNVLFQYISCYSLSSIRRFKSCHRRTFQYISCYSLSILPLLLEMVEISFNTSHVTLYLLGMFFIQSPLLFQYISCYSLSNLILSSQVGIYKFQYISCYSLSLRQCQKDSVYLVSIHLMLLFIPRFIGFSFSNSFYNTAKYKGLQDFYQPTSHFLFTQSKPGIPPYFQYFSFFYENPPGNFYNFSFNLLKEFPCHVFTLTGEFFYYKIKSSPLSFFPFPSTSSPNTLSFINFIIHTKSSSLSITRFSSFLNCMNFDGVMSPLKTDFWK